MIGVAALLTWRRAVGERRWTERFLEGFGEAVDRERDVERAAAWFRAREQATADVPPSGEAGVVDDRTWRDLDMDAVWMSLDRTASQVGAQMLYDRLRRPITDMRRLAAFERDVEAFRTSSERRARVTRELLRLRAWHVAALPDLLWGALPARSPYRWIFVALSVLMVLLLALIPVWPRALIGVIAVSLINYLVKVALRPSIEPYVPSLRALPLLIGVVQRLSHHDDAALDEALDRLRRHRGALRLLQGASRWVAFESMQDNPALGALADLARSLQEYVNVVFLLDVNAFNFAVERVRSQREPLREVFETVGTLDAAIAVASVRTEWEGSWCRPEFGDRVRQLHAIQVRHPLIVGAIANDFEGEGASWLVTGSNMSGKSTFLRTVGVNAILARTINTCRATRWAGTPYAVRSCIGRSDSILEGKSYYLTEVEVVRGLLDASRTDEPQLFILDELFRGTNTVERIAAARAVLEALDRGPHLVLVATHDIELLRWLSARYAAWHFREQIVDGALVFDYRLRPGPSSTRNAVALLRHMGYPADVVQLAEATVAEEEGAPDGRTRAGDGLSS